MPIAAWPPLPETNSPAAAFFSAVAFGTPRMAKKREVARSILLDRSLMRIPCTPWRSIATISIGVAQDSART